MSKYGIEDVKSATLKLKDQLIENGQEINYYSLEDFLYYKANTYGVFGTHGEKNDLNRGAYWIRAFIPSYSTYSSYTEKEWLSFKREDYAIKKGKFQNWAFFVGATRFNLSDEDTLNMMLELSSDEVVKQLEDYLYKAFQAYIKGYKEILKQIDGEA